MDLSNLFTKDTHLNTKAVTVDRRRSCGQSVEWQYYTANEKIGKEEHPLGICAFCGCNLKQSLTKNMQTLLAQGDKVQPNCGKASCLQLNPKANFKDGWTVTKTKSKRKSNLDSDLPKGKKT